MLKKLISVFAIAMFLGTMSAPLAAMAVLKAGGKCCVASHKCCCPAPCKGSKDCCCKDKACKDSCVKDCSKKCPTPKQGCCKN